MKSHYRRISKTALGTFIASLAVDGQKPREYEALGSIGAVKVGVETAGWIVLEVIGPDSDKLPGKLVSESFGGLKDAARSAVHRCRIRETVEGEDGKPVTRTRTVPENALPPGLERFPEVAEGQLTPLIPEEGDAVLEEGINPHRFI